MKAIHVEIQSFVRIVVHEIATAPVGDGQRNRRLHDRLGLEGLPLTAFRAPGALDLERGPDRNLLLVIFFVLPSDRLESRTVVHENPEHFGRDFLPNRDAVYWHKPHLLECEMPD